MDISPIPMTIIEGIIQTIDPMRKVRIPSSLVLIMMVLSSVAKIPIFITNLLALVLRIFMTTMRCGLKIERMQRHKGIVHVKGVSRKLADETGIKLK